MLNVAYLPKPLPAGRPRSTLLNIPAEVLCVIFSHVSLADICAMLQISELVHHHNFRSVLAARIRDARVAATNRAAMPSHVAAYLRQESFLDRLRLEFIDPASLAQLLHFAAPTGVVTVSFYLWSLKDLHQCMLVCAQVPKSGVRFNVELEFDQGMMHIVDLSMVVDVLSDTLGDTLHALCIANYMGDLQLNMAKLRLLGVLRLINTNVTFTSSFEHNTRLRQLVLHPNCNGFRGNNPIIFDKLLPRAVELLRLGQLVIIDPSYDYGVPDRVRDLAIITVRDTTKRVMPHLIEKSPPRNSFEYETALAECSVHANYEHIQWLIQKENVLTKLGLTSIRNETGVWDFTHKPTLREFRLTKCNVKRLLLPPDIVRLDLSNNNIENVYDIVLKNVSPDLVSLDLSNNPIDWDTVGGRIEFPLHLRSLRLANTNIAAHLPHFVFPDLLLQLALQVNQIELIDGVRFPVLKQLELNLGCNRLSRLSGPWWVPVGARVLELKENYLRGPIDFRTDVLGNDSAIEVLNMNYNYFQGLLDIRFPKTLRVMNIDQCKIHALEDIEFPPSLVELSICGSELATIRNVSFGDNSQLKSLRLAQNKITEQMLELLHVPATLTHLNLSSNLIRYLPRNAFCGIPHLEQVNLSANLLSEVDLQFNGTLEVLELSLNQISAIRLLFPRNCVTLLAMLGLSTNRLELLTPQMIGHGVDGTYHNRLVELDVSENGLVVDKRFEQLPLLISLIEVGSGMQDRYGCDIATNIVGDSYCIGKKTDFPDA